MYLLDTNIVSELRKLRSGKADPNVSKWAERIDTGDTWLSVVTVQELEIGVRRAERKDAAQGRILRQWLDESILPAYRERLIDIDLEIARCSASMHVPDPRPFRDCLIAATAVVHGLTVVTRNTVDFDSTGADVFNPWQAGGIAG